MFWLVLGTILSAAATGLSIASSQKAAKAQAGALKQQAQIRAQERAKSTRALAGRQKASFLSSGISLTGEGTPQALIGETFDVGLQDINLIEQNFNRQIGNVFSKARASAIRDLGSFALSVGTSAAIGSVLKPAEAISKTKDVSGLGASADELTSQLFTRA